MFVGSEAESRNTATGFKIPRGSPERENIGVDPRTGWLDDVWVTAR